MKGAVERGAAPASITGNPVGVTPLGAIAGTEPGGVARAGRGASSGSAVGGIGVAGVNEATGTWEAGGVGGAGGRAAGSGAGVGRGAGAAATGAAGAGSDGAGSDACATTGADGGVGTADWAGVATSGVATGVLAATPGRCGGVTSFAKSCSAPVPPAIVIRPPHTEHRARTLLTAIFVGSTRKIDRHSGQVTFIDHLQRERIARS